MTQFVIATSTFQSQVADLLPCNKWQKSQLTHALINAYSLLGKFDYVIAKPCCRKEDLLKFHSEEYVEVLLNPKYNSLLPYDEDEDSWSQLSEMAFDWATRNNANCHRLKSRAELHNCYQRLQGRKRSAEEAFSNNKGEKLDIQQFNLEGDCPIFSYLPMYCKVVTGATLMLADYINLGEDRTIAINWDGGRHHAMKQKASGFCYVNDIVLTIQKLRAKGFQRISYVDFDLHHGDGVENAFKYSTNVQTLSLHLFEHGFFPTTGSLIDAKKGRGVYNIPLSHGLDDEYLHKVVEELVFPLIDRQDPQLIIIQCGGDGLIGDGYAEWQLSIKGLSRNIIKILNRYQTSSVVLLGGGGYNETVMSRYYTYLTGQLFDSSFLQNEDAVIPEHEFADAYHAEHYKFWAYETEGSLFKKTLRNDNHFDFIEKLKKTYGITAPTI
ncbi:HOS1 (YPR068C) [Zygosaccharomyces parabailii]|uniref:histone deacetylase n=1 Tax=Zygosaccharomyces bailii (strain CLIB 213 / ATCC 58445 / CBS 680 / BCRC 21525 / NBRC 1098 / NCYC 1416 / NRRL Y-2227) TaxID=1333698 RepID=A0A8J2X851_ZYGB2|nr:HOS1 (YPR068C) [Zygosaccharomyces parabailii]CDF89643.1 ZYBA0S04-09186g1_1 [Zygosaccharomyces bailii CLIB 213]CDH13767.1 related to Histone deacetylase HOS1 [Zygosaccharomyces bailii ISA1307]